MSLEDKYPEHQKLALVQPESQRLGEFIEWLSWNGMAICEHYESGRGSMRDGEYVPVRTNANQLLAKYFGIDLAKIEAEKCSMLDEMRRAHERAG